MRLTEDKIRRIAESLHDGLEQQGLLEYKDARGAKPGTGRALRRRVSHTARDVPTCTSPAVTGACCAARISALMAARPFSFAFRIM